MITEQLINHRNCEILPDGQHQSDYLSNINLNRWELHLNTQSLITGAFSHLLTDSSSWENDTYYALSAGELSPKLSRTAILMDLCSSGFSRNQFFALSRPCPIRASP